MKLQRTLFLLGVGMVLAGFVQAESASLYVHYKKGGRHVRRSQTEAVQQVQVSQQADVSNIVVASTAGVHPASHQSTKTAVASVVPEPQPIDTIMPKNGRVVEGDETKNEFYILAEGDQEPVKPIDVNLRQHQMAVDTQLNRVDTKESMWSIKKPAHVDAILSQIAHKATVKEQHSQQVSSVKKTTTAPLFKAEKNGDIVDMEVALDKVFAEVDARSVMPADALKRISPSASRHAFHRNAHMKSIKSANKKVHIKKLANNTPRHLPAKIHSVRHKLAMKHVAVHMAAKKSSQHKKMASWKTAKKTANRHLAKVRRHHIVARRRTAVHTVV